MPNFEVVHTCRDFDSLKEWVKGRDANHNNTDQIAEKIRSSEKTKR